MNSLTKDLKKMTLEIETQMEKLKKALEGESRTEEKCYFQKIHLMPPAGWLNDPNGLCQYKGLFHAFFQYSPFDAEGGLKLWGHCTSTNMTDWKYEGAALYPDQPFDCHGVYSGSAFIENERMYLYYTGNVKLEDREDYDYINSGREANTVLVESKDGFEMGRKRLLMKNTDYPDDLTLHVRDPKVWKEENTYYMIQGARSKKDVGEALIFESSDLLEWKLKNRIRTEEPFGYMWECPDYFEIDKVKILSASVQGLTGEEWKDRNVYQSGYFLVKGEIIGKYALSEYHLWDYGFDYYAPQSFETEDGRRIQIGWMGMPDCEEYTNPTIEHGWQHCFTFPREVYVKNGEVCQRPVKELEQRKKWIRTEKGRMEMRGYPVYDVLVSGISENRFRAVVGKELFLEYGNGRFEMRFSSQDKHSVSGGRHLRYVEISSVEDVRILADVSSIEVFVNGGQAVFSTRYYPEENVISVEAPDAEIQFDEIISDRTYRRS